MFGGIRGQARRRIAGMRAFVNAFRSCRGPSGTSTCRALAGTGERRRTSYGGTCRRPETSRASRDLSHSRRRRRGGRPQTDAHRRSRDDSPPLRRFAAAERGRIARPDAKRHQLPANRAPNPAHPAAKRTPRDRRSVLEANPAPTVPRRHEKKTMGSLSKSVTTHRRPCVANMNWALMRPLESAMSA